MLNKVQIIGRLGKDPEVRRTQSGDPIVNLRVATSETWRDKQTGERQERTEWHSVVIFNDGIAKVAEQYLKKGSLVYVEGALQTRKWTDKDGAERYSTEIVLQKFRGELRMLSGREEGEAHGETQDAPPRSSAPSYTHARNGAAPAQATGGPRYDLDDDIPF
jgi:single-strand DNA-binding protein